MLEKSKDTVFSLRIAQKELAAVEIAANKAGMTTSEYFRRSVALRPFMSILATPQIGIVIGNPYTGTIYSQLSVWSENHCVCEVAH